MRILFYTHRFGREVVAGAELHLWNLVEQMAIKGHAVSVVTTLQSELRAVMRFGLRWHGKNPNPYEEIRIPGAPHPVIVYRFPVKNLFPPVARLLEKHLQGRWEKEEMAMEPSEPIPAPFEMAYPMLLSGWHLPELAQDRQMRWTMQRATVQLPPLEAAALHIHGYAPKTQTITFSHNGKERIIYKGSGNFQISIRLDDQPHRSVGALNIDPPFRPLKDSRTLGVMVTQVSLSNNSKIELAPFQADHRTLRASRREGFIQSYLERAKNRPRHFSWVFDQLRGPRCPGMAKFLKNKGHQFDWVVTGIFPFSNVAQAVQIKEKSNFKLAILPLFHVDDDFYYWQHYIEAMQKADVCLANSWFSQEKFFPVFEANSITAGAGVNDKMFRQESISGERFRQKYKIPEQEKLVLSVGRKSGTKRYRTLIRAIDNIQHRMRSQLLLVGPDEDHMAITSPNCTYLGVLSQEDLMDAYDACDVFALMSESESFGMVFVEAWMREKPVIGNRSCAPVSYLIRHEETGLLVSDRSELEDAIVRLLENEKERADYGKAGLEQALANHTWPVIADKILNYFESH